MSFMWGLVESFLTFKSPALKLVVWSQKFLSRQGKTHYSWNETNASTWDATQCLPPAKLYANIPPLTQKKKKKNTRKPQRFHWWPLNSHTHSHTNLNTQGKKSDANFQTANSTEDGHNEATPTHFCGSEFSFFSLMDPAFHLKASSLSVLTLACISAWPPLLKLTFCDHRKLDRMDDSILFNPLEDYFSHGGGEEGR